MSPRLSGPAGHPGCQVIQLGHPGCRALQVIQAVRSSRLSGTAGHPGCQALQVIQAAQTRPHHQNLGQNGHLRLSVADVLSCCRWRQSGLLCKCSDLHSRWRQSGLLCKCSDLHSRWWQSDLLCHGCCYNHLVWCLSLMVVFLEGC